MKAGSWGLQPALSLIDWRPSVAPDMPMGSTGRIAEAARLLGVEAGALRSWLIGKNMAPAEMKIRLAEEVLGVPIEQCWTPEFSAALYVGPRGGRSRAAEPAEPAGGAQ